jgi:hypothetical protein
MSRASGEKIDGRLLRRERGFGSYLETLALIESYIFRDLLCL